MAAILSMHSHATAPAMLTAFDDQTQDLFVERISNVAHANGVFRITLGINEDVNNVRPSIRLLVPANQLGPMLQGIANAAKNVPKPLTVNMGLGLLFRGTTPLIHPKRLEEMGVAMVSYPRLMSTGAVRGMMNAMDALGEMMEGEEPVERPDLLVPFNDLNKLVGVDYLDNLENRYVVTGDRGK